VLDASNQDRGRQMVMMFDSQVICLPTSSPMHENLPTLVVLLVGVIIVRRSQSSCDKRSKRQGRRVG
jgi:hypothetical protein